jgi:hypothetical protein
VVKPAEGGRDDLSGGHPPADRGAVRGGVEGLKDLSDILDPPSRSKRGFEQRIQHLTDILEALISQHEESGHS